MKIFQISLIAANLSASHSGVLSCGLSKQMWLLRNLKRFFDIIASKTKWLSFGYSLSVIWRFTPSIPLKYVNLNNASISTLFVILTHVYWLDSLKLSLRCKRTIVSFILVFLHSKVLSMISLSKYKWKLYMILSSMFSILFALFGGRQRILPEMVLHFCSPPVVTECSELHQIFFVFFSFVGPR